MNNLHDTAVLGISKILERFSYFAYILAQENDKTLNFFEKMRRRKLYKTCINKYLLQNKKELSKNFYSAQHNGTLLYDTGCSF